VDVTDQLFINDTIIIKQYQQQPWLKHIQQIVLYNTASSRWLSAAGNSSHSEPLRRLAAAKTLANDQFGLCLASF
jgi:hypothetical protein